MVKEARERNFEEEILKSDLPVLVDFCAPWCGPCKRIYRVVEKLSDRYRGKIKFFEINVDEVQKIARKFGITSIPTLMFFKKGKVRLKLSL